MTAAGLLLLYAALGALVLKMPALSVKQQPRKPQINTGRCFIDPEALDERKTTR